MHIEQHLLLPWIFMLCPVVPPTPDQPDNPPGHMTTQKLKASGFQSLIDKESLSAWDLEPWHRTHWIVNNSVISYDGKSEHKNHVKNSLWTSKSYGDFSIYCEWRLPSPPTLKPHPIVLYNGDFLLDEQGKRVTRPHLDSGDSGLYFRGSTKCQANIWSQELGSGEINGYRVDRTMPPHVRRGCIPIKKADRPLGQWNCFLITLQKNTMTVVLNGETVIHKVVLPDLPESGPIALQHHHDPVEFRQMWIKDMSHEN